MPRSLFAHASRVVLILASFAGAASAQANLSTQGFGFPPGQLSTRAWGTGGSIADIDPLSPVNPASVALHSTRIIVFQLEPEYRTLKSPAGTEQTTIARYPNVFVAFPVGRGWVVSAGGSTLLDRTSTTEFNTTQILPSGPDTVPMHTQSRIDGAMSDLRLAGAYTVTPWLRVGVGLHAITGHNLVEITQSFTDSVQFSAFTQSLIVDFQVMGTGLGWSRRRWSACVRRGHGAVAREGAVACRRHACLYRHYERDVRGSHVVRRLVRVERTRNGGRASGQRVGLEHWR
jgi:long-subunit fatty acid transport protein